MRLARFLSVCVAFLLAARVGAASFPLGTYNLVVLGNLSSSSEVEGRTWVGGNLTGGSSNYGIKLNGITPSVVTLAVGGNIAVSNVNMTFGSATYGGSLSGNINLNQSGATKTGGVALDNATMSQALHDASTTFKNLSANSSVSLPSGQPGPVNFNVSAGVTDAVFSVTAAQIFGNNNAQQINLNNASGVNSIVINVAGTNVDFNGGTNFTSAFNDSSLRSKIVWNFYQATTMNIGRNFYGSLLAPDATLTNSTAIEGSVGVANFTQNGEVHLPLSTVSVPEPAMLGAIGLAQLLLGGRRRA